jgi:hypothetical protein
MFRVNAFDTGSARLKAQSPQLTAPAGQPATSAGDPAAGVAHHVRTDMMHVMWRVPTNLRQAERSTDFLTLAQREVLRHSPQERHPQLIQRFERENHERLLGMRSVAVEVQRPFSAKDTGNAIEQAGHALRRSVRQSFATLERQARQLPPEQQAQALERIAAEKARVNQALGPLVDEMSRTGTTLADVQATQQKIQQALAPMNAVAEQLHKQLSPLVKYQVEAEYRVVKEAREMAEYNLFSRALQPNDPLDFSKLPFPVPATGPLNAQQAFQLKRYFEGAINRQFNARQQVAARLNPEHGVAGMFDANAQRDRMLVTAYQNILSRMEVKVPPVPPSPPVPTLRG